MSCVNWHIGILGESPAVAVEISDMPDFTIGLSAQAKVTVMKEATAMVAVGIIDAFPKFRIGIICKPGLERWLEVTPDEPAWLTEDNDWSFDYEVSSNLMWTIE